MVNILNRFDIIASYKQLDSTLVGLVSVGSRTIEATDFRSLIFRFL